MFSKKVLSILCLAGAMFVIPSTVAEASTNVSISPAIVSTKEKNIDFKLKNDTDEGVVVEWTAELISDNPDYLNYVKLKKKSGSIQPNKTEVIPVTISGDFEHVEMPVKLRVGINSKDIEDGNLTVNRSFEIPIYHKTKAADKVVLNYEVSDPVLTGNITEVSKGHLWDLITFNSDAWKLQSEGNMVKDNVYDIKDFENIAFGSTIDNKSEVSFPFESSSKLGLEGVNPIVDITGKGQVASPKSVSSVIYGLPPNAVEALVNSESTYIGTIEINADKQTVKTSNIKFSSFRSTYLILFILFYISVTVAIVFIILVIRAIHSKNKKEEERKAKELEKSEAMREQFKDRTQSIVDENKEDVTVVVEDNSDVTIGDIVSNKEDK